MKRLLLFILTISLFSYIKAQENTWNVYLQGQAVKSIDFENDYVWVATHSFLVRLNKLDKSTTYYPFPDIVDDSQSFLKVDKNGVIWIIRSGNYSLREDCEISIYSFYDNKWDKIEYNGTGPISSLVVDKDNNKWMTADGMFGHLFKLEDGNCIGYTPENSELIYDYVPQVASDKYGNIWLANFGNVGDLVVGDMVLMKYDGDEWTSYLSERCPIPTALTFDTLGNPWIQNPVGLQKLDMDSSSWSEQISLGLDLIYNLFAIEGENNFWFSKSRDEGIAVYNGSDWSFYTTLNSELPSDIIYQIAIDSEGTKWIGTEKGLISLEESEDSNKENSITSAGYDSKAIRIMELFPNPASDYVTIKIKGELKISTIDILNIHGNVIESLSMDNNQNRLDVSHFPAGVYLVRIKSQQNYFLKKFVKQ